MSKDFSLEEALTPPPQEEFGLSDLFLAKEKPVSTAGSSAEGMANYAPRRPFASAASAPAKVKRNNPPPESGVMGGDDVSAAIVAEQMKPYRSVMEDREIPVLPTEDRAVVNPQFVNAVQAQLNAMPANQRQAALDNVAQRPDVYGRAARAIGGRYAAMDKNQTPTTRKFDPRLEAQTERFAEQGMFDPESYAKAQALSGQFVADPQQMTADVVGEQAAIEAKKRAEELADAGFMERIGAGVRSQVTKAGMGLLQAGADLLGEERISRNFNSARRIEEAREGVIPQGESIFDKSFQGAMTSLGSQTPFLVLSAVTGTALPVLTQAAIQQFGDSYGEGKAAGLSGKASATRAIPTAAAEVFFERFGMTKALAGLKSHIAKYGVDSVPKYVAQSIATELPSELATTATQYAIDVMPEIGLNKNPSLTDLYKQLEETLRQTILQAGVTAGGTIGVVKGGQKVAELLAPPAPREGAYQRDDSYEGISELLARSKGFLASEERQQRQQKQQAEFGLDDLGLERPGVDLEQEPSIAADLGAVRPGAEVTPPATLEIEAQTKANREQQIDALATQIAEEQGIPDDDARRIATTQITGQELKEKKAAANLVTQPQADRVKVRAQELLTEGVTLNPTEAMEIASTEIQEQDEADALAAGEAQGETNAGQIDTTTSRTGISVAGQPGAVVPPGGAKVSKRNRVVSTGEDVAGTTKRKEPKPSAIGFRGANEQENKQDNANEVLELGNGARVLLVGNGDAFVKDATGKESGVIRQGDTRQGVFQSASELPAHVPEPIRQPLINYANALQQNYYLKNEQAQAALADARAKLEAAVKQLAPKPRGAPVRLTEGQKKQKLAESAPVQAEKARAERALTRINQTLDASAKPLTEDEFESENEYEEATKATRAKRREAIKELLILKGNPALRGTKVGERINEALSRPEISAKEKTEIQEGIDAVNKAKTSGPSASTTTKEPADTKYDKFTTGSQAISHIAKTGTKFQQRLAKRLRGFVTNVRFVVLEEGQEVPEQLKTPKNAAAWDRSIALYIENYKTNDKVIYVRGASFGNDQGINNTTVLHELLHAATNRKIALAKAFIDKGINLNSPVVKAFQDLIRTMNSAGRAYEDLAKQNKLPMQMVKLKYDGDIFSDPREFVAYGLTDETMQDFLMQAKGFEEDISYLSRFVRAIRDLFGMGENDTNALTDLVIATENILKSRPPKLKGRGEQVSRTSKDTTPKVSIGEGLNNEAEEVGDAVRTQKDIDRAVKVAAEQFSESEKGYNFSQAVTVLQMLQNPTEVIPALKALWKRATLMQRNALVKLPTTEFLADWAGDTVPELKNTSRLLRLMNGMTLQLLKSAGELTKEIERAFRADSTLRAKLDRITIMSTLAEVDPSDPLAKERNADLDKQYKALGADGQRVYKRIKQHFERLSEYFTQLLDDQITDSKLPIAEKANLMKKIRSIYETGSKITPYFPLVRMGDFYLAIGKGKTRKFFMFETAEERDNAMQKFADERIKQKPGESNSAFEKRRADNLLELLTDQEFVHGNSIRDLRNRTADSSALLIEIFNTIDGADLGDTEAKETLKDAVYQVYLQSMPDQSFRKQFIHRKGITGFRPDLLRNVAHTSAKMATQLARIKYAPLLRNSVSGAKDSILNRPTYEPFVTEMSNRVRDSLGAFVEGPAAKIVGFLNKASYIFYLSGASSALLQPLSIFQTGMPVLSRYGTVNATREMGRMMKVWQQFGAYKQNKDGTKSWVAPSVEHSKALTPEERRAVREMLARDVTTSTYTNAVFDYKKTPTENLSPPIVSFGKSTVDMLVLGGLMHSTERLSREMMFMSSFRLNRQAGKTFEQSIEQATYDTNEALGNYGDYNRPGFMRSLPGKVITQFMMYPLHVTLFLLKNFKEMAIPMDGRTRAEAAKKFFGTLGTSFVLAGAAGLPMFSVVMGLLGWAWEAMKDDDWPEDMKSMNFELWFRTIWLEEQLGGVKIGGKKLSEVVERGVANALTGLDISGRTSLNNLWIREGKETKGIKDEIVNLAIEKAGPGVNMLISWAEGIEAFYKGDLNKGVQKTFPAGFRNFVTAYNLFTEGAKDNKGTKILSKDAFSTGELIGQAVGFRSDLLANTQYVNFKVLGLKQRIVNERNTLTDNIEKQFRNKDFKKFNELINKDVIKFNKRYPTFEITDENILDSIEERAELRAESWRGVTLTDKDAGLFTKALKPSRQAAKEAEKAGRE